MICHRCQKNQLDSKENNIFCDPSGRYCFLVLSKNVLYFDALFPEKNPSILCYVASLVITSRFKHI